MLYKKDAGLEISANSDVSYGQKNQKCWSCLNSAGLDIFRVILENCPDPSKSMLKIVASKDKSQIQNTF